jgi:hypothetical protein
MQARPSMPTVTDTQASGSTAKDTARANGSAAAAAAAAVLPQPLLLLLLLLLLEVQQQRSVRAMWVSGLTTRGKVKAWQSLLTVAGA